MRFAGLAFLLGLSVGQLSAQSRFPIKVDRKWGLINPEGEIVVDPVYEAIGEFKQFGYAVMQRNQKVGLLDRYGKEIIPPRYQDLKVLDSTLMAVRDPYGWKVVDLEGRNILESGVERVRIMVNPAFLAFALGGKWGVARRDGRLIVHARYDEVELYQGFFQVRLGENLGLLDDMGRQVLAVECEEIHILADDLILYRKKQLWGGVDHRGVKLFAAEYERFKLEGERILKLYRKESLSVYSRSAGRVILSGQYDEAYALDEKNLLLREGRDVFLIDHCGHPLLMEGYQEILHFAADIFRVKQGERWGLVRAGDVSVLHPEYDYIGPALQRVGLLRKDDFFGLANCEGEVVLPPAYDRLELEGRQCKAYRDGALHLLQLDEQGKPQEEAGFQRYLTVNIKKSSTVPPRTAHNQPLLLQRFEWFYDPGEDKWGLRRLDDGSVQIKPVFDFVKVYKHLGVTLAGVRKFTYLDFDRTSYRFDLVFGLINNEIGLPVTEMNFLHINLKDFHVGQSMARCVLDNGRQALIRPNGKVVHKDLTYVGPFSDGLARVAVGGELSGTFEADSHHLGKLSEYLKPFLSPHNMVDYTKHDRRFHAEAFLYEKGAHWGYVDTSGAFRVPPAYRYAEDFVNEVGIVLGDEGWGAIGTQGESLVPCRYDGINFLENTDNEVLRIYSNSLKYGLIDTLGRLMVRTMYDDIGGLSEQRLAVQKNNLWGYVNEYGQEVIPCRFRKVGMFSEGRAPVQLGARWGFIDRQGDIHIPADYLWAGPFKEGLAWVQMPKGFNFIDRDGNLAIEGEFDKAYDFQDGLARVVVDGRYGLIDRNGHFLLRPGKFLSISSFDENGLAQVQYGNDRIRYGLIDRSGNMIAAGFREIHPFSEGLAVVKTNNGYGYINLQGRMVIDDRYSEASAFHDSRAVVKRDGLCGYVDPSGNEVVPPQFYKCLDFRNRKAVVYENYHEAGLIDWEGNMIIEPNIDRLLDFNNGRGLVKEGNCRFYYITEEADLSEGYFTEARHFRHGMAVVQVNGKWGVINQQGMEIIPPKYDRIDKFEEGYARVRIRGFNGLTNRKGQLIMQPNFEYISYAGDGLFRVEQGEKVGYFDIDGNWVWKLNNDQ